LESLKPPLQTGERKKKIESNPVELLRKIYNNL